MIVRELSEALRRNPSLKDKIEWLFAPEGAIINDRFGTFKHLVVYHLNGKPKYDMIAYDEHNAQSTERGPSITGAVVVPYFIEQDKGLAKLALIEQVRPAVINGKTGKRGKMVSLEFPRGLSKPGEKNIETALREGGEETGKYLRKVKQIGVTVPNTSFFGHGAGIYSAEFDPAIEVYLRPDAKERILSMNYHTLPSLMYSIRQDPSFMYCAFTKSALTDFISHLPPHVMLNQMNEFKKLAVKNK